MTGVGAEDGATRSVLLAAVDASIAADEVVSTTAALARTIAGAEVHLVHLLSQIAMWDGSLGTPPFAVLDAGERLLRRHESAMGGLRVTRHLAVGVPWRELLQMAWCLHADFVLGAPLDRFDAERFVVGSRFETALEESLRPVFVMRATGWRERRNITATP